MLICNKNTSLIIIHIYLCFMLICNKRYNLTYNSYLFMIFANLQLIQSYNSCIFMIYAYL